MKLIVALAVLLASLNTTAQDGRQIKLCKGNWVASLALNDAHKLPFNFIVTKKNLVLPTVVSAILLSILNSI